MSGLGWDADGLCDDHNRFGCKECALSQTLPAPGEVELEQRKAINTILARLLSDCTATASLDLQIIFGNSACDKILATVAAANDEGVARGIEIAAKVAEIASATGPSNEMWQYGSRYTREQIVAAIRLLSQGGGKA